MDSYLHKKVVKVPLYSGKLIILLSNDCDLVGKYLPDFNKIVYAHACKENYNGAQGYYCVLNFDYSGQTLDHGTIAHEATHLAMYVCEYVGIEMDQDNPEPLTYLVVWFTNEIYRFAAKHGFTPEIK